MLDRITNINTQEKYKNKLKVYSHSYGVYKNEHEKNSNKDSALFSALAKLMSKINWKILNVEYLSKDKMLLNFSVESLEFTTIINFSEMYTNNYQDFSILKTGSVDAKELVCEIKLSSLKSDLSVLQHPTQISVNYINMLFDRIFDLILYLPQNSIKNKELSKLKNDIEDELNSEFDYILRVIYTFIYTRNKSRVKTNFFLKTQEFIPIIIQKVNVIYS